jgi:transposase-like protein
MAALPAPIKADKIIYLTQVGRSDSLFLHEHRFQLGFNLERNPRFTLLTSLRSGTFSSGLPVRCFFGLRGAFMALLEMLHRYGTDEKCREILTKLRWPEGVTCPRCKERQVCYLQDRKQFECGSCGYQFSVTTGTIFNDTHLPLEKWFAATYLLCEAKKGMSACQIQRTLGISYKTAWYLCHRVRAAMAECDKPMLDGQIEVDETYVGGRSAGKRGRGTKKRPVIGIRQRNGEVRLFHAKNVTARSIEKFMRENLGEDVDVLFTDEFNPYPGIARRMGLKHKVVQHSTKEYVRGEAHTNTIESAFSLFKRGLRGSWHKLSAKHLQSYLEEMAFRFNRRKRPDLFVDTLRHMITAPVLTFHRLTA